MKGGLNSKCKKESKPVLEDLGSGDGVHAVMDASVNSVGSSSWMKVEGDFIRISSLMDSGCCDRVMPPNALPFVPVQPSEGSKAGQHYSAANGETIANLGHTFVAGVDSCGQPVRKNYQVAEVTRPLDSITALCDEGNRVIFGSGGGFVYNLATGCAQPFEGRGTLYELDFWDPRPKPTTTTTTTTSPETA